MVMMMMIWDPIESPDMDTWIVIWFDAQINKLWLVWWEDNAFGISYGSFHAQSLEKGLQNMEKK